MTTENISGELIITDPNQYKMQLRQDPAVIALSDEISVTDPNSVVNFGQKPAEMITSSSDKILAKLKDVDTDEASLMLTKLTKLMDKFDIDEIKEPQVLDDGLIARFKRKFKKSVEDIFAKYDQMGSEVQDIYVILKNYEDQIRQSNNDLNTMLQQNMEYYEMLEKYIVAGEISIEQLEQYKDQVSKSGNLSEGSVQTQLQQLDLMKELLDKRIYELRLAENVAMQYVPMLQVMQKSNFDLMTKINSSFIITLPIFKQALIQAVMLKRQQTQSKSIQQLDAKTNELLAKNAENTANLAVANAKLAGSSSIQITTLEQNYETITRGITETREITQQLALERKENTQKLEEMKHRIQQEKLETLSPTLKLK